MNKTFCVLPWVHVRVKHDQKVFPCSVWHEDNGKPFGYTSKNTIDEIANSSTFNQLRKNMLQGIPSEGCNACYNRDNAEKTNNHEVSMRQHFNRIFEHDKERIIRTTNADGSLQEPFKLKALFIQYSNLCNLGCRSCGPSFSSFIAQENKDPTPVIKITDRDPKAFEQIMDRLHEVEFINFAGGESAFIEEHWQILDRLIELKKTDVVVHWITNLSMISYKKRNLIEYSKRLPKMLIKASVDATHQRGELYRHNTVWSTVENNLKTLFKSSVRYQVHCTIGATNIWHLPDMHQYMLKNELISPKLPYAFTGNMLFKPEPLCATVLPQNIKKDVTKKIHQHVEWLRTNRVHTNKNFWNHVIEYMNERDNSHLIPKFIEYNTNLDNKRNQSLFETFPELRPLLNHNMVGPP